MKKSIYLFACHEMNRGIKQRFNKIKNAVTPKDEAMILFHQKEEHLPEIIQSSPHTSFSYNDISKLGYPMLKETLVPGSTHYPLLNFYRENPEYEYYWFIEYDVVYTGNWRNFFDYWDACNADFLTCHIKKQPSKPQWAWWDLEHPEETIELEKRVSSFNTIYRLSNEAIAFIDQKHREYWRGHEEVLIATLLHNNGFSLRDFGGSGKFVLPDDLNKFYIDGAANKDKSMRWRPSFERPGRGKNKLYHPVKKINRLLETFPPIFNYLREKR